MKFKKFFTLSVIAMLAITACKKNSTPTPTVKTTDVYVAGTATPLAAGGENRAAYWRNGTLMPLSDGTSNAAASSIAIVRNTNGTEDVYVAGATSTSNGSQAVYWKNGTLTPLSDGTSYAAANAIAIAPAKGGTKDVYVAGYVTAIASTAFTLATYWKNGVAIYLPGSTYDRAYAIAVVPKTDGTADVYVAGTTVVSGKYVAAYWKNDTLKTLGDVSIGSSGAYAIAVYGTHVYVAGYTAAGATYWDNEAPKMLPFVSKYDQMPSATGIAANNGDIYVSGNSQLVPLYWKNSVANDLSISTSDSYTTGIALDGDDIYVTGYDGNNNGNETSAGYWKNDVFIKLDQASYTNSIAVTSH